MSTTHRIRTRTTRLALLGLLAFSISSPARAEVDAWPALEVTDDSTVVVYPLYVHEGDFLMAFPFYYRTNEARDHHVLWPLLKVADGDVERVTPLYFRSGEGEFTLLPLIYQSPDVTALTIPPVVVLRNGDDRDWIALPNLYARYRDGELQRLVSLGLFDYAREGDARDLSKVLLLGAAHWGDDRLAYSFLPLIDYESTDTRTELLLAPYYFERTPDTRHDQLFPVFSRRKGPDSSSLQLLTYYREQSPRRDEIVVFPLFSSTTSKYDIGHGREESFEVLWPLYSRTEVYDEAGKLLDRNRRFAIFSDTLDREGARTFRVLGIVVRERLGK